MKKSRLNVGNGVSADKHRRPIVFLSSSVYDKIDLLDSIFQLLIVRGYECWLSSEGSFPVSSARSAFGNCIHAVKDADFFIGIISPWYGSGVDEKDGVSITHQEMREARNHKLPRLLLVDQRVVDLKRWLDAIDFKGERGRNDFKMMLGNYRGRKDAFLDARHVCDIRSVDLYDEMTLGESNDQDVAPSHRIGNWVQPFRDIDDVRFFLSTQFSFLQEADSYIGSSAAMKLISEKIPAIGYSGSEVRNEN